MRRVGFVLAVLVAAIVGVACDTSQPSEGGATMAEIQIDARGSLTQLFDCYDRYNAGTFDRVICFVPVGDVLTSSRPVPWPYSFRVIILRAGTTFPEVLAGSVNTGGQFPVFGNVSRFDTAVESAPIRLPDGSFTFQNPRRVSQGHPDYFLGHDPPIPLPTVNVLGVEPPNPGVSPRFAVELTSGDSIIVEAAKQLYGLGPPVFVPEFPSIRLEGRLFIDGVPASPHAGSIESATDDGAGISFNYISD